MTIQKLTFLNLTGILFIVANGCSDGPTKYNVTGSVKYRGDEVEDGTIIFESQDGIGPSFVGKIVDGQYSIATTEGRKVIRITATKETGRMLVGAMDQKYAETVDIIPPKYNSASTLVHAIDPNGDLVINFDLE